MPTATYTFSRTGSTADPLTVFFSVGGSATYNFDYTVSGHTSFSDTQGSITIASGQASANLVVTTSADNTIESDETVVIGILANANYNITNNENLTLTITNDDYPSTIIDSLTLRPSAAHSFRKLRSAYTGPCLRVRRSSDSSQLDIGFLSDGTLDTSSLLAFVGSGDGFIVTWYDQEINARNCIQSTNSLQPRIVTAGVLSTKNGKPCIDQTIEQYLLIPTNNALTSTGNSNWSLNYVASMKTTGTKSLMLSGSMANNWFLGWWGGKEKSVFFDGTGNYDTGISATSNTQSYTAVGRGAVNAALYRNGVDFTSFGSVSSNSPRKNTTEQLATNGTRWNNQSTVTGSDSLFFEILIFNSSLSDADRITLENSQISQYSLT